jgi:hypothetical protein
MCALGCTDGGVVYQDVERRHGHGEHVGEVGGLLEAGEVGDDEVQAVIPETTFGAADISCSAGAHADSVQPRKVLVIVDSACRLVVHGYW